MHTITLPTSSTVAKPSCQPGERSRSRNVHQVVNASVAAISTRDQTCARWRQSSAAPIATVAPIAGPSATV